LVERFDRLLPGIVQLSALNLSLTGQYLPDSNVGLKDPHGIATQGVVGNFAQALSHIKKVSDRCVTQLGEFGEDQILITEMCEPASQQKGGLRAQAIGWQSPAIQFTQH